MRKILAVDFDGTIVENKFPFIGELLPNAKEVINRFVEDYGCDVIVWTCRTGKSLEETRSFLDKAGVKYSKINENSERVPFTTSNKIYADLYIDDKAIFSEIDWLKIDSFVKNFFDIKIIQKDLF